MMRGVFVTGTDTGVGKTVVSALLLAGSAADVRYRKPVQTGIAAEAGDRETVAALAGVDALTRTLPELFRLPEPASPHHAARLAGVRIELDPLVDALTATPGRFIVEGAGGILVPLNERHVMRDLVAALGLPALVVSSTRLGTINHTLLTLEALERARIPTLGLVLVGPPDAGAESGIDAFAHAPVLGRVPHFTSLDAATVSAAGRALVAGHPTLLEVLG
jgi:dethiobiotin synthase